MNKAERKIVCELIASWEWVASNSNAEAYGFISAAESLRTSLGVSDEDLLADRVWAMGDVLKAEFTETYIDTGWSHDEAMRKRGFHWPDDDVGGYCCRDALEEMAEEEGFDNLRSRWAEDTGAVMRDVLARADKFRDDYE